MENVLHGRLGQKSTFSGMIGHYTESEKEKAFSILSELGLADQAYKRCDALSGGQKQRVGIARAIMRCHEVFPANSGYCCRKAGL